MKNRDIESIDKRDGLVRYTGPLTITVVHVACMGYQMVSLYLHVLRHAYYNFFNSLFSQKSDLSFSAKRLAKPFTYRQAVAGRCK